MLYFFMFGHSRVLHQIEFGSLAVCAFTLWSGLVFFLNDMETRISGGYLVFASITVATVNLGFVVLLGLKFFAAVLKEAHLKTIKNKKWKVLVKRVHKALNKGSLKKRRDSVTIKPMANENEKKMTEEEKTDAFWGLLEDEKVEEEIQPPRQLGKSRSFVKRVLEKEVLSIENVHEKAQEAKRKKLERRQEVSRQRLRKRLSIQSEELKKVVNAVDIEKNEVIGEGESSNANGMNQKVQALRSQIADKVKTYERLQRIVAKIDRNDSGALCLTEFGMLLKIADRNVDLLTVRCMWEKCLDLKGIHNETEMDAATFWKYLEDAVSVQYRK
jgi:hypothetical protein